MHQQSCISVRAKSRPLAKTGSPDDLAKAYVEKTGYALAEKMDNFVATDMTNSATQIVGVSNV